MFFKALFQCPKKPLNRQYSYSLTALGQEYKKFIWKVMAGLAEKEKQVRNWNVPELKTFLQARGISVSNKKKDELVELTEKANEIGLELTFAHESPSEVVNAKWVTNDGTIPNPLNLHSDWSNDFSDAPNFSWGDL